MEFREEETRLQSIPDSEVRTSRFSENLDNGVKLNNFRAISDSPSRQPQLQSSGAKYIDESKFRQLNLVHNAIFSPAK